MAASNAAAAARIGAQADSRVPSPRLPIQSNGSEEKNWRPAGGLSQSYPRQLGDDDFEQMPEGLVNEMACTE
ncbi:hypothetical protein E4U09_004589 [Claviceps aff. purpurea]|uniref:Uncharacterized protein n=1 Tax=Claviceps aff. purpurea TaxID=1967640 RepID=A0A9P7U1A0_9HYPO|nr:hypothetical protein E4U09_004589 [Claviceps aff. purpurea]